MDKIIKESKWFIGIALYMFITAISGFILDDGLVMFLTINMFLAGVGYGITLVLVYVKDKAYPKWLSIALLVVWILFFPNMIYITTDFIHLQNYDFFGIYSQTYVYQFSDWYVLFIIFSGAMISAKFGMHAVQLLSDAFQVKRYQYIYKLILFGLSSVGIYIGRFIRLNSWQAFRVDIIFREIFENFSFFIGFVAIFVCIHFIYDLLFSKR